MTHFSELPDYMSFAELRKCFIDYLIVYANNTNKNNVYYALDELLELSDRQWHTYEYIDKDIKEQLQKYITSIIDFDDEDIMESILCIIPRLGLGELFLYIVDKKDCIENKNVLKEIISSEEEYGDTVNDPYSGM